MRTPDHRVAHDPPGIYVLDRTEVKLALRGGVLRDIGEAPWVSFRGYNAMGAASWL